MSDHRTLSADPVVATAAAPGAAAPLARDLVITAEPGLRRCWYAVAFDTAIGAEPVGRRLLGTDIVLWRSHRGDLCAAIDRCPHRWAKLSEGASRDGRLVCPYHGWAFDHAGRAVLIPQLPVTAPIPPAACLRVLPCRAALGLAWVSLEPDPVTAIPDVAEFVRAGYRTIPVGVITYDCNAAAVIDNNTDSTHVAFVHANSFGAGQDPRVPPGRARSTPFGIVIESGPIPVAAGPGTDDATHRTSTTEIWLPFVQVSRMRYPDGTTHVLLKACCPVDDGRTAVHLTVLRDDVANPRDAQAVVDFELTVEREDAAVLRTLPDEFPLDVRSQCHLRHDRGGIAYRRALARLLRHDDP